MFFIFIHFCIAYVTFDPYFLMMLILIFLYFRQFHVYVIIWIQKIKKISKKFSKNILHVYFLLLFDHIKYQLSLNPIYFSVRFIFDCMLYFISVRSLSQSCLFLLCFVFLSCFFVVYLRCYSFLLI